MQPSSNPFDTARRPRLRICIPWILAIVAPQAPVMAQKLAWEHAFRSSQDAKGAAAALHSDGKTSVSPQKPAKPGEIITLFGTGLGSVSPSLGTGEPSTGNNTGVLPTVTVDSQSATVKFSGAAPAFVGLNQVSIQIPSGTPTATEIPVVLTIGGKTSNTVTVAVAP